MSGRIGLYGGSFNPIHCGHLIVVRAVAEQLDLGRVIFLPSARPPHKADEALLDYRHRAEMVKLAIADEPRFEFSDFDLARKGLSYTIDTVAHFRRLLGPDAALHWIIGADSLAELTTWSRVSSLVDACRIVTAVRAGWEQIAWDELRETLSAAQVANLQSSVLETPVVEVSSTDIRYLVPDCVRSYIGRHALYRNPAPGEVETSKCQDAL